MKKGYQVIAITLIVLLVLIVIGTTVVVMTHQDQKTSDNKESQVTTEPQRKSDEQIAIETAQSQDPTGTSQYQVVNKKERDNGEVEITVEESTTKEQQTYIVEEDGSIYQEFQVQSSGTNPEEEVQ